jgi:hypothetical protein
MGFFFWVSIYSWDFLLKKRPKAPFAFAFFGFSKTEGHMEKTMAQRIHKRGRRSPAKKVAASVDPLSDLPILGMLSAYDLLPLNVVRLLVGEMAAIRGTFDQNGAERPTEEEIGSALIRAVGYPASAEQTAILRDSVPGIRKLILDVQLPRSAGQEWKPALVAPSVAFDERSSLLVAKLHAMLGTVDASGAHRPTEEDICEALIGAAGDRECADETTILDSAVPAMKELMDASASIGPSAMLTAMNVAREAISRLMAPRAAHVENDTD